MQGRQQQQGANSSKTPETARDASNNMYTSNSKAASSSRNVSKKGMPAPAEIQATAGILATAVTPVMLTAARTSLRAWVTAAIQQENHRRQQQERQQTLGTSVKQGKSNSRDASSSRAFSNSRDSSNIRYKKQQESELGTSLL